MKTLLKWFILVWFLFGVVAMATEVHVKNFTGTNLLFEDSAVRLKLPQGISVFEWADSGVVDVGTSPMDLVSVTLTAEGITEVVAGLDAVSGMTVTVVEGQQGRLAFFGEGFGLGLLVFGYGLYLRVFKNIGRTNVDI